MWRIVSHALQEGATSVMQPANQFHGDRSAEVKDPFGNRWWIDTHIEDLSREEVTKRIDEYIKKCAMSAYVITLLGRNRQLVDDSSLMSEHQ